MATGAYPSIKGKVVLLTGATGPIGRALVDAFLDAGATLALCVRRMVHLPDLAQRLEEKQDSTMIIPCDLRFEENVVRMIHRIVQRHQRIDVVVNAACLHGPRLALMDYPADPWRDVIATNLTGPYLVCREVLPWMVRARAGSIINITSELTLSMRPNWAALGVSNFGVEGMTRLLATELKSAGIRVNTVDLGMPTSDAEPPALGEGWTDAFLWLASDESEGRTGERIDAAKFVRKS